MTAPLRLLVVLAALAAGLPANVLSAQELDWAQKMFEKQSLDFGVVARGAQCTYRLKVTNLYQEVIHITSVTTSCSCATARAETTSIPSGQDGFIEISMNTTQYMREKTSTAIINLSEPTKRLVREVRIPLKVYIRTDVVFNPGSVNFGALDAGIGGERSLAVNYAGRNDWKILEVRSPKPYLIAQAVEASRANGLVTYTLKATLRPDAPVGALREQLLLITDDQANPQVPLSVEGRIEADITLQTDTLAFGTVPAGQSKTINLVIRGKRPFKIAKIEGTNPGEMFKVKLPADEKPVHVLPITFTAPLSALTIDEAFTVTIEGRPEPLTFKATGKVTPTTTAVTQ